jgi:hypothetical protein
MSSYMKLHRENQWMAITYHLGAPVRPSGTGLDEAMCPEVKFTDGQDVRVQWPNGETSDETLVLREQRAEYSDMGHECVVTQRLFGVVTRIRGVSTWIEISELRVSAASTGVDAEVCACIIASGRSDW